MPPRPRITPPSRRPRVAGMRDPRRLQESAESTGSTSDGTDHTTTDTAVGPPSDAPSGAPSDAVERTGTPGTAGEKGRETAPRTSTDGAGDGQGAATGAAATGTAATGTAATGTAATGTATTGTATTGTATTGTAEKTDAPASSASSASPASSTDLVVARPSAPPTSSTAPTGVTTPVTGSTRFLPAVTGPVGSGSAVEGPTEVGDGGLGSSRVLSALLATLIVVALVVAGVAGWQGYRARSGGAVANRAVVDPAATAEVVGQTREAVEKIFSYDPARLDDSVTAARTLSTGGFTDQYLRVFEETIRGPATQQQLRQTAQVLDIGVRNLSGDRATLMAMVQFSAQRTTTGQQTNAPGLLTLEMQRVDGRWKLATLEPLTARR